MAVRPRIGGGVLEERVEQRAHHVLQRLDLEHLAELGLGLDVAHEPDALVVRLASVRLVLPLFRLAHCVVEVGRLGHRNVGRAEVREEGTRLADRRDVGGVDHGRDRQGVGRREAKGQRERGDAARKQVLDELAVGDALLGKHLVLDEQRRLVDVDGHVFEAEFHDGGHGVGELLHRLNHERMAGRVECGVVLRHGQGARHASCRIQPLRCRKRRAGGRSCEGG